MRTILVAVLVLALSGVPAFAGEEPGPLAAAAARAAVQLRPAPRGENPYMLPGLGLVGAGGTLVVLAMAYPSGVKCSADDEFMAVACGTTHNKGLIGAGAALAGLGAFLILRGESRRDSFEIVPKAGGFAVRHRVRF